MKRVLLSLALMVLTGITLNGCTTGQLINTDETDGLKPTEYQTVNNLEGINITVKEGSVSPSGLTLKLYNNSNRDCIYGEFFVLEQKIDDKFYQIPVIYQGDYGFEDIGYNLDPGDEREWEVDWHWLYGNLKKGRYRIVKDILDFRETGDFDIYYLAVEFQIE